MNRPRPARSITSMLALILCTPLMACGEKKPEGQVIAVVDGQEVTRREVAAEPQAADLGDGDNAQSGLGVLLGGVIDRKLAAAEAKRLELDRTPQYQAQVARIQEVMLSRTLFDRWAAEVPQPGSKAVAAYIAANPQSFAGRKLLLVDRIESAGDRIPSQALAPLQTNDAVAAYLGGQGVQFRRSRSLVDTASLALPLYRQLVAQAPGSPLVIEGNGGFVSLAVIEMRDAPLPVEERAAKATTALKQVGVQKRLAELRAKAKIAYQPGFRPSSSGSAE